MLKIFDELRPFFEDNYRRINVREYARIRKISPPSASTLLGHFHKERLLTLEQDRRYHFFSAHRTQGQFIALQRAYYQQKLQPLVQFLEQEFLNPVIILFGSVAKAEVTGPSDVDLAVFSATKKKPDLTIYEKKLDRTIQLFVFKDKDALKNNQELLNNILNGSILSGAW